jgi:hypothetical protein
MAIALDIIKSALTDLGVEPMGDDVLEVAAQGTITMSGLAIADETFVIGDQTFTWKAARSTTGEVTIGVDADAAVTNIITAVNTDISDQVVATYGAGDTVIITAAYSGAAGNSIVFTESSTNMAVDGAGVLGTTTSGVDGAQGRFIDTGLVELNNMLGMWSAEGLMVSAFVQDELTLVADQEQYEMASGAADFDTARAVKLISAFIRDDGTDQPLTVYNSLWRYNRYAEKTLSGKPTEIFYEASYPSAYCYLWPSADDAYTLFLTSEKYLTELATSDATVNLPPEYKLALSSNLALILAPKFGAKNLATIVHKAEQSKDAIITQNVKKYVREANFDRALTRRGFTSIDTGYWE